MASHGVLIMNKVAASDVRTYNRSAVAGSAVDLDNGNVFRLDTKSSGSAHDVWLVTTGSAAPTASGSTMKNLWMACSPEITTIVNNGKYYRGAEFGTDPRDFYNIGAYVLDAFKLQPGDLITLSSDAISGSPSTGDYVIPAHDSYELIWAAAAVDSWLNLKLVKETYISLATGAIDDQRELAYELEVISN